MKTLSRKAPILAAACACGILLGALWPADDDFFALRKSFEIYGSVYEELVAGYVDRIEPERLMRTGIDAMLGELDPFTVFFDEADNADMDIITRGSYSGVGLSVGMRMGRITVLAPIEDASGYKQGVRAGDIIVRVDNKSTDGLSISDVQNLLRGEAGTTVEIAVVREGQTEPVVFVLTRDEVKLNNVTYSGLLPDSRIGYVRLERFAYEAGDEVREAFANLVAGGGLEGLVLDLRDNPGGLLDAAVEITGLFVPTGSTVVSTNGRLAETKRVYSNRSKTFLPDVPLVVVVNHLSASASEIVAGAVQDLDRGIVLGSTTFGKGLVQIVRPLPYNTSLKLTTSRYYTPSGRSIQSFAYGFGRESGPDEVVPDETFFSSSGRPVRAGHGIEPDVHVDVNPSPLEGALARQAAFFFFANHFAAGHETVRADFVPDDRTMEDFRGWLNARSFTFETPAEIAIEALSAALEASEISRAGDEVDRLRSAVKQEKEESFDRHRERLRERLRAQIVARYHAESVQIQSALRSDPVIREAAALLRDRSRYDSILGKG